MRTSENAVKRLSENSRQPRTEGLQAVKVEHKVLVVGPSDHQMYAPDSAERLFRQSQKGYSAKFALKLSEKVPSKTPSVDLVGVRGSKRARRCRFGPL
jgi:hypothetical protein